jgi:hypothetical protein
VDTVLSQLNPLYSLTSNLFKVHFNIILTYILTDLPGGAFLLFTTKVLVTFYSSLSWMRRPNVNVALIVFSEE